MSPALSYGRHRGPYRKRSRHAAVLIAMYRDRENLQDWPDFENKLGDWADAFASETPNPGGELEAQADFSGPRTKGRATKARDRS